MNSTQLNSIGLTYQVRVAGGSSRGLSETLSLALRDAWDDYHGRLADDRSQFRASDTEFFRCPPRKSSMSDDSDEDEEDGEDGAGGGDNEAGDFAVAVLRAPPRLHHDKAGVYLHTTGRTGVLRFLLDFAGASRASALSRASTHVQAPSAAASWREGGVAEMGAAVAVPTEDEITAAAAEAESSRQRAAGKALVPEKVWDNLEKVLKKQTEKGLQVLVVQSPMPLVDCHASGQFCRAMLRYREGEGEDEDEDEDENADLDLAAAESWSAYPVEQHKLLSVLFDWMSGVSDKKKKGKGHSDKGSKGKGRGFGKKGPQVDVEAQAEAEAEARAEAEEEAGEAKRMVVILSPTIGGRSCRSEILDGRSLRSIHQVCLFFTGRHCMAVHPSSPTSAP